MKRSNRKTCLSDAEQQPGLGISGKTLGLVMVTACLALLFSETALAQTNASNLPVKGTEPLQIPCNPKEQVCGPSGTLALAAEKKDGFFESGFAKTLGFISDGYGALQAAQALATFLGLLSSDDIAQAKQEIINAINIAQREDIKGEANGIMENFHIIVNDDENMLPLDQGLLDNIVEDSGQTLGKMMEVIKDGDPGKVYPLAPAFNALAVTRALAIKRGGHVQSEVDRVIQETLQYNYVMVGADLIDSPQCACSGKCPRLRLDASRDKILWGKITYPWFDCAHPNTPITDSYDVYKIWHPSDWPDSFEYCDLNSRDDIALSSYRFGGCFELGGMSYAGPKAASPLRPDQVPACYNSAVSHSVEKFNQDQVVALIKNAMLLAKHNNFDRVTESNGEGVFILNTSFALEPPVARRLRTPVCPH